MSPYDGIPPEKWEAKTKELIEKHPLKVETIREIALESWKVLWQTTIGEGQTAIKLSELDVPSTVLGYFFEKLFARELQRRDSKLWRGGTSKEEKDIVYLKEPSFSVEIKTSGQLGTKIFGNRSYGQESTDSELVKKEKSGYYITVNFYQKSINLIRFGWIDHSDWQAQTSATGQASTLKSEVYKYKLVEITGDYRLNAPIRSLEGVGSQKEKVFASEGVKTLLDLKKYQGSNQTIKIFQKKIFENPSSQLSLFEDDY